METLAYIHLAMSYEEAPDIDSPPSPAVRGLNWWQMSSTAALVLVILFGGFTKVVSAFATPNLSPVQQESTTLD